MSLPLHNLAILGTHSTNEYGMLLSLHLLFIVLAYVQFILGCAVSLALIFQESLLKKKRLTKLSDKLPSLLFLDRLNRALICGGFALLCVGVVLGIIVAHELGASKTFYNVQFLWVAPAWAIYGLLSLAIVMRRFGGRRVALYSLVGFSAALISFVGTGFKYGPLN